jgi:crotonobetainyl-CoA:carnitine CoA-transferase CaiB-like acyl-CoA transferase
VEHGLPPPRLGEHANEVLEDWPGLDREEIGALRAAGAL